MKKILCFMAICHCFSCYSQPAKDVVLLGSVVIDTLQTGAYKSWYQKNYENYHSNSSVRSQFNKTLLQNISIESYFGSWCGDSKREVPRFVKLVDEIGFNKAQFKLIGLGSGDSLYKQSPGGEEKGKGIFKVPVFIVYKNGKEIGRINEYPVESLERDLLAILKNENYTANYRTFSKVNQWLNTGILLDSNVSTRGLAGQLKSLAENEYELNSVARLISRQGMTKEALKLFAVNNILYPASQATITSLAEAYIEDGNKKAAIALLERSLETKPTDSAKPLADLLVKAKQ